MEEFQSSVIGEKRLSAVITEIYVVGGIGVCFEIKSISSGIIVTNDIYECERNKVKFRIKEFLYIDLDYNAFSHPGSISCNIKRVDQDISCKLFEIGDVINIV